MKAGKTALVYSFFTLLAALLTEQVHAQYSTITLGKRQHILWSRSITPDNIGNPRTYYYTIYFQNDRFPTYRPTGVFGSKIERELNLNLPDVAEGFRQYQRDKKLSYLLLGGAVVSLLAWSSASVDYIARTEQANIGAFFRPPQVFLLGAYVACFGGSIHLNLRGDRHLQRAVWYHNQHLRSGR